MHCNITNIYLKMSLSITERLLYTSVRKWKCQSIEMVSHFTQVKVPHVTASSFMSCTVIAFSPYVWSQKAKTAPVCPRPIFLLVCLPLTLRLRQIIQAGSRELFMFVEPARAIAASAVSRACGTKVFKPNCLEQQQKILKHTASGVFLWLLFFVLVYFWIASCC